MMKSSLVAAALIAVAACDGAVDENVSSGTQAINLGLTGSRFEIDDNANLKVDDDTGTPVNLDWGTVDEMRKPDTASGQGDDSFGGGAKEDDACPSVGTGSIPNNKSDLKNFGVYAEPGANPGDPGFLHMFWHRVQEPTGTTLMDFEFNQSADKCANGVNPIRQAGDLLIEYRLEQGGATASLKLREWTGSAWGPETNLTDTGDAIGTINSSSIPAADSDGLGDVSPRTFGEATISLESIFKSDECKTFGSAFVKSRSSDAFNSALKDFIAPLGVNITNCGKVIIRKKTEPAGATDSFLFSTTVETDEGPGGTFSLADGESKEFGNVLFGNGYTVTESVSPGYTLKGIDCSASTSEVAPTVDVATSKVTFSVMKDTDIIDCTYTNEAKGTIIIEKVSTDGTGTFNFSSSLASGGSFALQTSAAGIGVSTTFADKPPGTYAVAENVPAGWNLVSATCSNGSPVSAITLAAGETVKCTFTNARVRGAIRIIKTRYHAIGGFETKQPHGGVEFTVAGGSINGSVKVTTSDAGIACVDGLLLSDVAGDYSVTETVPFGYTPEGATTKTVSVVEGGSCAQDFAPVAFHNLPLTNLTVSVDSQIDGGTLSTIQCGSTTVNTAANGDGSLTLSNLTAGTYTCTVVIKH